MRPWLGFLGLTVFASLITACTVDARGTGAEGTFTRAVSVSGPVRLDVETGSGSVDIRPAESGMVTIQGRISTAWRFLEMFDPEDRVREIEQSPPIEQAGNEIRIGRWRRWEGVRISYVINVPSDTTVRLRTGAGDVIVGDVQGSVTVTAGSGDIRLGTIGGDIRARTGSGDVDVDQAIGKLEVASGSGDVRVQTAGSSASEISTGSGDVAVEKAAAALRVRTGSGEIAVSGAPSGDWTLGTGSGDVSIRTPSTAAFSVDIRSASGDIRAPVVQETEQKTRHSLRGTVHGGGPLVSMSTGSGEIRVR